MMNAPKVFILSLFTLIAASANAQLLNQSLVPAPYSTLKTLAGYQPSVIASEAEAKKIYDFLPTDIFKGRSGCFQRAHNWSYGLNQGRGIKSMKVFLFFTRRYQREFDYDWAYHVAPLIPVQMNDGSIQEMVFDPTFTSRPQWVDASKQDQYDNKPISISEWIKYFIYPDVECPLVDNYDDYFNFQERYYCYIMKAPMYNYIPDNFDDDLSGKSGSLNPKDSNWFDKNTKTRTYWRSGDIEQMKKAYSSERRE